MKQIQRVKLADTLTKTFIITMSALATFVFLNNTELIDIMRIELSIMSGGKVYLFMGKVFVLVNLTAILWYLRCFFKYRPLKSVADCELPMCTVVVPAYNEGSLVKETIKSVLASDYPEDKLQIIAVDDGSVDDTWEWMVDAEKEGNGRVSLIKQPENRGKREALTEGFIKSSGDVIITVDSDSTVAADTIRNMVSPFVKYKEVGAIAGNVRVLNRKEGLIPKMLDVVFTYSFDFIRAAQSTVNTVMCTPGALSAYRKEIVFKVLDTWRNQIFLGEVSRIGEDRAMTNLILKNGYHVRFQQNAIVYTNVPVRWKNLYKMLLRWARSNIRETLVMSKFIFTPFRNTTKTGARLNFSLSVFNLIKTQIMLLFTVGLFMWRPLEVFMIFWLGSVISLTFSFVFYTLKNRNSEGIWIYCYGLYWMFGLSWIAGYALLTPHKSGWLTRDKLKIAPVSAGVNPVQDNVFEGIGDEILK